MENNELSIAYAEVYEILSFMEPKYIDKIPLKLMELFREEKLKDYKPNIEPTIPLDEQKLQKKTLIILAMLNINYWCEDENEKKELIKLYSENDKRKEEELRERYNPDNLFKKKDVGPYIPKFNDNEMHILNKIIKDGEKIICRYIFEM